MKISLQWLQQFVDIEVSPQQLADDLTNVGVVVEALEALGSDVILGLDLTTNRPDCLSHLGVAREVATLYQKPLRIVEVVPGESRLMAGDQVIVEIEAPQLCARYCARVIHGAKVATSPEWLARRLEALGLRTINNVADVTNYVLMEMGQPLHAFDLEKIAGHTIVVREAYEREKLVTIDAVRREVRRGMLVIADRTRPLALAGIMGGTDSEIGTTTRHVLLESAWFDPVSVRKTTRALGMHTDASHRFERGADVNMTVPAINRAAALIQELAGGEIAQGVVDNYPRPLKRRPVFLRQARICQIMGAQIPAETVERILGMLNFNLLRQSEEGWEVELPSSRLDVEREVDLIEEIARHYGYSRFSSTLPAWQGASRRRPEQALQRELKQTLIHMGYSETMTYSFVDQPESLRFSQRDPIRLSNALSSETEVMRTSLLPGLLHSVQWNYHRGLRSLRLFEMGKIYFRRSNLQPDEKLCLAMVATGNAQEKTVHHESRIFNFFDLKGDIETLFASQGVSLKEVTFLAAAKDFGQGMAPSEIPDYYQSGRSAGFVLEGRYQGFLGQLHPTICEEYKIKQGVWVAEIPLCLWQSSRSDGKVLSEIPKFPSVQRDLSLIVKADLAYTEIESTIEQASIKEIRRVFPFDLYTGEQLPPGKKGISIAILYQATDRTLVEEEVNRYHETIVALLADKLGAQLRA
jgi:phenylalanyl-tRNA synthetase beta chain